MTRIVENTAEAVRAVFDGAQIAVGGFGPAGNPEDLLGALAAGTAREIHLVANGARSAPIERLLDGDRIRKFSSGFVFAGPWRDPVLSGRLEIEVLPQGTLTERLRAGAAGIAGFFTPTGAETALATGTFPKRFDRDGNPVEFVEPKEIRSFDGRRHVFERAITPDFGFVKASKADRAGNLVFHRTTRNFNPVVAMAARCTIVQADEIVEIGAIDPDDVHVPGRFVDILVHVPQVRRPSPPSEPAAEGELRGFSRDEIARRIGRDIEPGWCVNLGVGMPLLAGQYVDPAKDVNMHMENGVLGAGGPTDAPDPDTIDPGGGSLTLRPGAAIFDSVMSFTVVRGGFLDLTVLGGLQVSGRGDLANFYLPGGRAGVGGAMDLVAGAKRVWVAMEHTDRRGGPKIVEECTFALTGPGVVDRVYTNFGVFSFESGALELIEAPPDVPIDEIRAATGAPFRVRAGTGI